MLIPSKKGLGNCVYLIIVMGSETIFSKLCAGPKDVKTQEQIEGLLKG